MANIKHRKNYKSDFKAKVALEAVRGRLTINEIAKEFGGYPNQISKWKKQFLKSLPQIFENSKAAGTDEQEELVNQYQSLEYKTPFEVYQAGLKNKENKGAKAASF
jgi:transposase-like protein